MVHADDVADAIERVLVRRVAGAFNLAAEPPLTTQRIAEVFGARAVHVPARMLRVAVAGSWHARLQQVDPGWVDIAVAAPLLDTTRARTELGWSPTVDAITVLSETLSGLRNASSDGTPALRPRSVVRQLRDAVRRGPVQPPARHGWPLRTTGDPRHSHQTTAWVRYTGVPGS
jgi:hypothetical protein